MCWFGGFGEGRETGVHHTHTNLRSTGSRDTTLSRQWTLGCLGRTCPHNAMHTWWRSQLEVLYKSGSTGHTIDGHTGQTSRGVGVQTSAANARSRSRVQTRSPNLITECLDPVSRQGCAGCLYHYCTFYLSPCRGGRLMLLGVPWVG